MSGNKNIPMPEQFRGKFFNGGCTEPCDMADGPCTCGAWHSAENWPEEVRFILEKTRE